jgi:glyoxylase-like metal-dependent hydrolase (beta-lactamase superfamily II)
VPTFTAARHLYTEAELEFARTSGLAGEDVYGDSIAPILDAGLADVVAPDADLGHGIRLESTAGHTPGHVSMWIESDGERVLLAGDFMHHPVQFAEPHLAEIADADVEVARETRVRMIREAARTGALVLAAHFPNRPAGRVVVDGDAWRFVAE